MSEPGILIDYKGKIAIITLNVPHKLNALNGALYYQLASAMHEVASHDEVFITVLTGKGRFFSACAPSPPSPNTQIVILTTSKRRRRNLRRRHPLPHRPGRPADVAQELCLE